jgi:hypothetical protein
LSSRKRVDAFALGVALRGTAISLAAAVGEIVVATNADANALVGVPIRMLAYSTTS